MSANTGEPAAEPLHLLLFYAFVSGLARDLLDGAIEHGPIEPYRRASTARAGEFSRAAPECSELTIALALSSYLDDRVFLLGDQPTQEWSTAVIRDPAVTASLRDVGRTLAAMPAAGWLGAGLERSAQAIVDWANSGRPPDLAARESLVKLAEQTEGEWWSAPAGAGLPCTTRKLRSFTAVELICRDDGFGETEAAVWDVAVTDAARVAEVRSLADWSRLVAAYPLDVTWSRGEQWSPSLGWPGPWLLPDWDRVAQDWDGVHVTADAYLRSRGQLSRVGDGATALEGWDPDTTYWLSQAVSLAAGGPQTWVQDAQDDQDGQSGWRRTA
ncbi:MAG TPA: hypothetical protein VHZ33_03175 [Trebonia sp.]|nr:hypothetical protein [Trebonia sp.]